jgi:hypothetical protein
MVVLNHDSTPKLISKKLRVKKVIVIINAALIDIKKIIAGVV